MQNNPKISPTQPIPGTPNKEQTAQPRPEVEINPGRIGNNTEVDLDTTKIKTYPDESSTEQQ